MACRPRLSVALACALAGAPLWAAQVRIPVPAGSAADIGAARVSIRLITADGKPVIGWVGDGLATEYADLALTAPLTVTLAAQSQIALPNGAPTWYEIAVSTKARTERVRVQVPDLPGVQELRALVTASAVPAADILAGRLLPATSGAAAGWGLILNADLAATWSATGGGSGCATLACLLDGPSALGSAGQALVWRRAGRPGSGRVWWARPGRRGRMVRPGLRARRGRLVRRGRRGRKVRPGLMAPTAPPVRRGPTVLMAPLVPPGRRACRVQPGSKVPPGQRAPT